MRRVLLVAPWEHAKVHNARSGNLLQQFALAGADTTLLCQAMHTSYALGDILRHSLSWRMSTSQDGQVTTVLVDPFLNYAPGIRANHLQEAIHGWHQPLRQLIVRCLAPLGLLKDLSCLLTLWLCGWTRLEGTFDWCLGFGPRGALIGWLLKKVGKVRMLVYEDQDYEPGFVGGSLRRWATAGLERFLAKRADLVISVGHRLASLRRNQTGRAPYVVHNGAALTLFASARERVSHPPTLVFVGNLSPWDGLDLTIEALPVIRKQINQIRLLVVADGSPAYRARLLHMVSKLGLDDVVQFLGPKQQPELPLVFRQADIGLAHFQPVPFRVFSFPLKVLEYMTSGLPVIGTVDTEAGDLLQRCECGLAIPFTTSALAEAVCSLLLDEKRYERYRTNGIKHSQEFAWPTLFKQEYDLIATHYSSLSR